VLATNLVTLILISILLLGTMSTPVKRWKEQRWLLDAIVRTVGVEWDQGRLSATVAAVGVDLLRDANQIRERVKKFSDITREYARLARSREEFAKEAERESHFKTAEENYLAASVLFGGAIWPIWEDNNTELIELSRAKNRCYDKYIQYAGHHIERIELPFEDGKTVSAVFHLPEGADRRNSNSYPCAVLIPGMDGFKERTVRMDGDKMLKREIAVLAIDGPGQGESLIRGIKVTESNHEIVGKAAMDFLEKRNDIDTSKVALHGTSMGSYWVPRIMATDSRYKVAVVTSSCHEPGMETIFNWASPSFKYRFMWMSGIYDEEEFDQFARKMSLKGVGAKIKQPFLITAGEDDPLSPVRFSVDLYHELVGPKMIMVYEGEGHGIRDPRDASFRADWLVDRFEGRSFSNRMVKVDSAGNHKVIEEGMGIREGTQQNSVI
jgi:dipeptidyl aminopeptidase/acylaminoacyl peptidase